MSAAPRRHHRPIGHGRALLEERLIAAGLAGLGAIPLERALRLSAAVASVGPRLAPRLRRLGLENLERAFPERTAAWRQATLRGSFRSLGRLVAEVAHFGSIDAAWVHEHVRFADAQAEALWRERFESPGGAIVATGHFGNWELFAHAQGVLGRPVELVHRPLRNPRADDLLRSLRARAGTGVIYKHAAAREILRRLRAGAIVAIPIDQHAPGGQGVPIPFFGRPAATTLGPARLAQIARVPIQVAALAREGDGPFHRMIVRPPLDPPPRGRDATALVETMGQVLAQFEEIVRTHPDQWLWLHRRWRLD